MPPPEIDFRLTPNSGHSEAHAGLPLVTQSGHSGGEWQSIRLLRKFLDAVWYVYARQGGGANSALDMNR